MDNKTQAQEQGRKRRRYRISEAARELEISAEWLRMGESRGFFPEAPRDRNGHRYYTREDIDRLKGRRTTRVGRKAMP